MWKKRSVSSVRHLIHAAVCPCSAEALAREGAGRSTQDLPTLPPDLSCGSPHASLGVTLMPQTRAPPPGGLPCPMLGNGAKKSSPPRGPQLLPPTAWTFLGKGRDAGSRRWCVMRWVSGRVNLMVLSRAGSGARKHFPPECTHYGSGGAPQMVAEVSLPVME